MAMYDGDFGDWKINVWFRDLDIIYLKLMAFDFSG
jgi:hypothetical protein